MVEHHVHCVEEVQRCFADDAFEDILAVYAFGSVVSGGAYPGFSDVDIFVFSGGESLDTLMAALKMLNDDLLIVSFHVHTPADTPPRDLLLRERMKHESRLLAGNDVLADMDAPSIGPLLSQLDVSLSHRAVMMRKLACSKTIDSYRGDLFLYHCLKHCLFAVRAGMVAAGSSRLDHARVLASAADPRAISMDGAELTLELHTSLTGGRYPDSVKERVALLNGTIQILGEAQRAAASARARLGHA